MVFKLVSSIGSGFFYVGKTVINEKERRIREMQLEE